MPLVSSLVRKVRLFTTISPPVDFSGEELDAIVAGGQAPATGRNPVLSFVRPTLVVDSPVFADPLVLAPYGAAEPDEWQATRAKGYAAIGVTAAVLVGIGFALGRTTKRG